MHNIKKNLKKKKKKKMKTSNNVSKIKTDYLYFAKII